MNTRTLPNPWRFALDRHDDPQPNPAPAPPAPDPADPPNPADPPAGDPAAPADGDKPLGPAGEKALAAMKERARVAEAEKKALEAKVREFEDRDKTDLEKAQATAAKATAEAESARAELLRQRIVNETGLSAELAEFLPTGDEDTVRAAAAKLAAATVTPKTGPKPDPSQGSGRPVTPTDYRTAPKGDVAAKLRDLGVRSYR